MFTISIVFVIYRNDYLKEDGTLDVVKDTLNV